MAVLTVARDCFRTRAALQMEVLALRHPLSVLRRSVKRAKLTAADRFLWARLSRYWTGWRSALVIVKPETVIDWQFGCSGPGRCAAANRDDRLSAGKHGNRLLVSGVRVHYQNLQWHGTPLMDDNAVSGTKSSVAALVGSVKASPLSSCTMNTLPTEADRVILSLWAAA
jgi:hypothetical protein